MGVLLLCRDAVGVFYNPSQLGRVGYKKNCFKMCMFLYIPNSLVYNLHIAHFTLIACVMGGKCPYSCFVGCCFQDLFKTTCSIFVLLPSSFFPKHFVRVQIVQPLNSTDMALA